MENSSTALGIATQTQEQHIDYLALHFHNQEIEVKPSITAAFAIVHQRYHDFHHNTPVTSPTCHKAHTFRYTSSTPAGEPNNHYHLADKRNLWSEITFLIVISSNTTIILTYALMTKKQHSLNT